MTRIRKESRFLFIVGAFPPSVGMGGIRVLEFSKRLVKNAIFPIILTRKYHKKEIISKSYFHEIPSSLLIYRSNYFKLNNRYIREFLNLFCRIDYYFDWIPFAYFKGKKILRQYKDIKFIYSTGLPLSSLIIGYLLKLKFKIPLIVEYRDPLSFSPFLTKKQLLLNQKIDLFLERKWLNSADIIITVSPKLNQFLKKNFPFIGYKPIYSIPNGLNFNPESVMESKKKKEDEIIITFTGKLYGGRDLSTLLRILTELKKEQFFDDFKFKFKIFGAYKKKLEEKVLNSVLKDLVFFGGFITCGEVFNELSTCDLAVHIGENMNYPTLAFKIFDYLSVGKKILYLGREDSYTAEFLKENDFGIILPIDNLFKSKQLFKKLLNDIRKNNFNYDLDKERILQLSWDNRSNNLMDILSKHFNL